MVMVLPNTPPPASFNHSDRHKWFFGSRQVQHCCLPWTTVSVPAWQCPCWAQLSASLCLHLRESDAVGNRSEGKPDIIRGSLQQRRNRRIILQTFHLPQLFGGSFSISLMKKVRFFSFIFFYSHVQAHSGEMELSHFYYFTCCFSTILCLKLEYKETAVPQKAYALPAGNTLSTSIRSHMDCESTYYLLSKINGSRRIALFSFSVD